MTFIHILSYGQWLLSASGGCTHPNLMRDTDNRWYCTTCWARV